MRIVEKAGDWYSALPKSKRVELLNLRPHWTREPARPTALDETAVEFEIGNSLRGCSRRGADFLVVAHGPHARRVKSYASIARKFLRSLGQGRVVSVWQFDTHLIAKLCIPKQRVREAKAVRT